MTFTKTFTKWKKTFEFSKKNLIKNESKLLTSSKQKKKNDSKQSLEQASYKNGVGH